MIDVEVIADPGGSGGLPGSGADATAGRAGRARFGHDLAAIVRLPRQNVNYHLKALERHGLVELVEERRKGNMTERLLRATAASFVISPAALAAVQPDPSRSPDRLSARWLIAVASRLVRDVGELVSGATKARKRLATFAMDGEVRFASAADRAAFAEELATSVTRLIGKYHHEAAERGRDHRVIVAVHPSVKAEAIVGDRPDGP